MKMLLTVPLPFVCFPFVFGYHGGVRPTEFHAHVLVHFNRVSAFPDLQNSYSKILL